MDAIAEGESLTPGNIVQLSDIICMVANKSGTFQVSKCMELCRLYIPLQMNHSIHNCLYMLKNGETKCLVGVYSGIAFDLVVRTCAQHYACIYFHDVKAMFIATLA